MKVAGTLPAFAAVTMPRVRLPPAFIAKNYAGKKVAVIDDKSAYGKGLADVTRKELTAAGFEVSAE